MRLKPISPESVAGALAKAERYRLLNEPEEAESICRDILEIEPDNQQALVSLILALTDQIPDDAQRILPSADDGSPLSSRPTIALTTAGIAWERRAKARHRGRRPRRAPIRLRMDRERAAIFRRGGTPPRRRAMTMRFSVGTPACVSWSRSNSAPQVEEMREPIVSE